MPMDERYQGRAPWHDAALELRGPVVGDLLRTFIERWDDPTALDRRTPYRMLLQRRAQMPRHPSSLPESFPDPQPAGGHAVQVLRTYDSELTCAVLDPARDGRAPLELSRDGDGARTLARNLRLELWGEHLGRPVADPALLDPGPAFALWKQTAADLDAWHAGGCDGPRPRGQIRAHEPEPVTGLARLWAGSAYRNFFDPDDRSRRLRRRREF